MTSEQQKKISKKQQELIDKILLHRVDGESYISTDGRIWKWILLTRFLEIHRGEMTVEKLLTVLQQQGVRFNQSIQLVEYPVRNCLHYIAKVTNKQLDI
jgi:hypothetical protein